MMQPPPPELTPAQARARADEAIGRLKVARSAGVASELSSASKIADGAAMLACVLFAALVAIGFGAWTLCALLIAVSCRPGFWLGVVVVAVLSHLAGWW
jgi:hypothetical protein